MNVLIMDPLVGNEYAACLSKGLGENGEKIFLSITENREVQVNGRFEIVKLSPAKDKRYGKLKKGFKYLAYFKNVLSFIKKNKIDVIHYQFFRRRDEILFFYLLKKLGHKLVFTAHNVLPHERSKLDYYLKKIVYKTADEIIVHSNYIKEKLLKNFPEAEGKTTIIPHGNFDNYLPKEIITKDEARKKLGFSPADGVLLFFGYIREYKGLDLLLDAFKEAYPQNKNIKLLIAGNPQSAELRKRYEDKIKGMQGVTAHLKFIPADEVAVYLSACDAVVLPYKDIDHSGIIHLAYSFGKPVIATRVGDFPESIEDGKSGFLLKENTKDELKRMIINTFSDTKNLEIMGAYCTKLNHTKYSWNEIAVTTISVYKKAIQGLNGR